MKTKNKTKALTTIAMLTALSVVLYFLAEIPIIPIAPHLKIDLSDVPALISAIILGPISGIVVEFLKNIIHLTRTGTFGLGELANFCVGVSVIVPFSIIYNKNKKKSKVKAIILGFIFSALSIIVIGIGINALIYPLFMKLIGVPIDSTRVFITYLISTITMNLIKASVTVIPVIPLLKVIEKQKLAK